MAKEPPYELSPGASRHLNKDAEGAKKAAKSGKDLGEADKRHARRHGVDVERIKRIMKGGTEKGTKQ